MDHRQRQLEREASETAEAALAFLASQERMQALGMGAQTATGRRFVLAATRAVSDVLARAAEQKRVAPAVRKAVALLGPEVAAFSGVAAAFSRLLDREKEPPTRSQIVIFSGASVRHEMDRRIFADTAPGLRKRLTARKNAEHMSARKEADTMRRMARKQGIPSCGLSIDDCARIGGVICEALKEIGIIEMHKVARDRSDFGVTLTADILEAIAASEETLALRIGTSAPMVCPPDPWGADGKGGGRLSPLYKHDNPVTLRDRRGHIALSASALAAINALQAVPFAIDNGMREAVAGIVSAKGARWLTGCEPGGRPAFPNVPDDPSLRTERQAAAVRDWSRKTRQWHAEEARAVGSTRLLADCLRFAGKVADEAAVWLPARIDWRGRMYYDGYPLNPQGAQPQRAFLRFANGHAPGDAGERWMMRNLASLFGFDKCTPGEQIEWVKKRSDDICRAAADPVASTWWRDADCPLQFLQACREWRAYCDDRAGFRAHAPIHLDGSCNGSQHLAAMGRSATMARAVNITAGPRSDLYQLAADALHAAIKAADKLPADIREMFAGGVPRALVKPIVMNLPYGLSFPTATEYLRTKGLPASGLPIDPDQHWRYARELSSLAWHACTSVCGDALAVMKQINGCARSLMSGGGLEWRTADDCVVTATPGDSKVRVITTRAGSVAIREGHVPSNDTRSVAPNFTHSCDATHMRAVINAMVAVGHPELWMIHDSFGCLPHAADDMQRIILDRFAWLHGQADPFRALYLAAHGAEPDRGWYDPAEIMESVYAFR